MFRGNDITRKIILIVLVLLVTFPVFATDKKIYTDEDLGKYKNDSSLVEAEWMRLDKTSDFDWYYEKESVYFPYQDRNIVRLKLKAERWNGEEVILLVQISCQEKQMKVLQMTAKKPGSDPFTTTQTNIENYITEKSSLIGKLHNVVCRPYGRY